jgi:hypothetical protein
MPHQFRCGYKEKYFMAIDFPNSPVQGSTYSYLGITYTYEDTGGGTGFWKVSTPGNTGIATSTEVDTGTNNGKYLTPLAIDGSKYGVAYDAAGTAATANTGTGANDVPTNADVRNPRNRIVNPSMAISQENGFGPNNIGNNTYFTADQWSSRNGTAGTLFGQLVTGSNIVENLLTATVAVPDLTGTKFVQAHYQELEALNVYDLNGGDVSISAVITTNWSGILSLTIRNSGISKTRMVDVPVTSGVNNIFEVVTFESSTVLDNDNGMGITVSFGGCAEGIYQGASSTGWVTGNFLSSSDATQWVKNANNYVKIGEVDIYAGNVPRKFQPNSYAQDLAECQRYGFEPLNNAGGTGIIDNGYFTASTTMRAVVKPPVPMRADSVVVSNSGAFTVYKGGNVSVLSITLDSGRTTANSVVLSVSTGAGASANDAGALGYGSTNAKMFISARL